MDITLLDHITDLPTYVAGLNDEGKLKVLRYLQAVEEYKTYNKIQFFVGEEWQKNAITLGIKERYRGVIAGNRLGKSYFGTYETAVHLTGKYPKDWTGHKFNVGPINAVALGVDFTQIAKPLAMQELLLGSASDRGAGWIPKDDIVRMIPKMGVRDVVATVYVKHYDENGLHDGESRLDFGSYTQGDSVLMGAAYHWFLIDECPDDNTILEQAKKRTWSVDGLGMCVFTPEKGLNATVEAFWNEDGIHHSGLVHVSLWDSTLYSQEEKMLMNNSIAPWQRAFSIEGIPTAGTGAVFAGITKASLLDATIQIQPHWKRMAAIDFGFKDTNVVSFITKDPDSGIYYLYDEISTTETEASYIATTVKEKQLGFIPMIYPADGEAERGLGETYAAIYKRAGCVLTDVQARNWYYDPEGKDRTIQPGILFMRELMQQGRLKVHPRCTTFLKEFDLYSYDKAGKFIDKHNHAIDSVRYNLMAIDKFGKTEKEHTSNSSLNYVSYQNDYLAQQDIY